jgi:hypothetical protein
MDQCRRKRRVQRQIADLQVIDGEVSFRKVKKSVALVIRAVIGLSGY